MLTMGPRRDILRAVDTKWTYRCRACLSWGRICWAERHAVYTCWRCAQTHLAPTPAQDAEAYVDTRRWPAEMELAVRALRGDRCVVPGCVLLGDTLDHRVAWRWGGKTSVANLQPMCSRHNSMKADEDYRTFLFRTVPSPGPVLPPSLSRRSWA